MLTTGNESKEKCEIKKIPMRNPFKGEEILKSAKSMKNNKAVGIDDMAAEYIKYGDDELCQQIAELLNETAETGNYPKELRIGILTPLPKSGKKSKPKDQSHLRPIILLSTLRKILAITMLNRIWNRLSTKIPKDQAAYQSGRSTTEQIFAIKLLVEKAITSDSYKIYLLMLDMSKAFDTVTREKLLDLLAEILEDDELNMLKILINDVAYLVKVKQTLGEEILTEI